MGWKETLDEYREEKTYTAPEQIYEKAGDVHVRKYQVYGDATDNKLYASADFQKVLDPAAVFAAAVYGTLMIFDGTNYLEVVSFVEGSYKTLDLASTPAADTWTVATEAKSGV